MAGVKGLERGAVSHREAIMGSKQDRMSIGQHHSGWVGQKRGVGGRPKVDICTVIRILLFQRILGLLEDFMMLFNRIQTMSYKL